MSEKRRKKQDAEWTKEALLQQAQLQFAEYGYAGTSIDEVVRREQLTKGAVYYYFKDKKDLFAQVVDRLLNRMVQQIASTIAQKSDPWEKALTAIDTYLEGCLDKEYRQIVLRDAPVVLGWTEWREKERQSVVGLSTLLLEQLMEAGLIKRQPLDMPAYMLFGAVTEAGIGIAESDDPARAREQAKQVIRSILQAL